MSDRSLLDRTRALAEGYLESLPNRPVGARAGHDELRAALGGPMPEAGEDAAAVVESLARGADAGLVASAGPRYFGFVIGGALPASLAADWLASAWDQNGGLYVASPAAAVVEEISAEWLLDLLGLPAGASVGFVTGCQMANFTGLLAARHAVLERAGWDVERRGLVGAPAVGVVIGEEAHATILAALRMAGLGDGTAVRVPCDDQGRMRPERLEEALASCHGPTIVCAQAGHVSTGAFDPLERIVEATRRHGAWLHVDGAFGLWAAASPDHRHLVAGASRADSWATDAHKWLNVPYDSGIAVVARPEAHRAALTLHASYLLQGAGPERDGFDWVPDASRRARGFALYAALRHLGRAGVAALVSRCCRLARRMAEALSAAPGVGVLNDVVLNQVLVRLDPPGGREVDEFTRAVIGRVQAGGVCWLGGARWKGADAIRISVSGWSTTEDDVDRSAAAILAAVRDESRLARSAGDG